MGWRQCWQSRLPIAASIAFSAVPMADLMLPPVAGTGSSPARVTRPGGESRGDNAGDLAGGAAAVGADEGSGGGGEFGPGGVLGEQSGADELAEGVGGAAEHRVVLTWRRGTHPMALTPQCGQGVAAGVGGGGQGGR